MNVMRNERVKKDKAPSVVSGTAGAQTPNFREHPGFGNPKSALFLAVVLMGPTCTPVVGLVNQLALGSAETGHVSQVSHVTSEHQPCGPIEGGAFFTGGVGLPSCQHKQAGPA